MDTDTRVGGRIRPPLADVGSQWRTQGQMGRYMSQNHARRQDLATDEGDRVGKIAARYVNISVRDKSLPVKVALCQDAVLTAGYCLEYARPLLMLRKQQTVKTALLYSC